MKNWLPLVLAPAFAMLKVYGRSCLRFGWNSSSNSPPQMLSPPVPVPVRKRTNTSACNKGQFVIPIKCIYR